MKDRIALVTGGMGTIGSAIIEALHQSGCKTVSTRAVDSPETSDWQDQMKAKGIDVTLVACDVSDFNSAKAMVEQAESEVGPIDILVNVAGITRDSALRKMSEEQWHQVIAVNLDSVFNTTRNVINGMLERKYGRVINISSINGQKGQFGQSNYAASKAGMHGFTMSVALEVARKGITVNTISPGYIDSPMINAVPEDIRAQIRQGIPVGRFGQASEIARTVAFLAADDAGFITGADISVNGGQYM